MNSIHHFREESSAAHLSRIRLMPLIGALLAVIALIAVMFSTTRSAFADDADSSTTTGDSSVAAPVSGPVPNIIVTNFTYGDGSVPVGGTFDLAFTFQNMGNVAVQNMVIVVDGGENFSVSGGTNTFYVQWLDAGYSLTQTVPMQALASAKSGAQGITLSFKYEYVDQNVRSSNSSDIKISVPVSQPDRFQVNDPVMPDSAMTGQETTVTLAYVNKGKGDISNVEAVMEGDGFEATAATQYVGNVASGANGSIGYAFTPTAAGDFSAKLKVNYEDSDGQAKTKEFPIAFAVADPAPQVDPSMGQAEEPEQKTLPLWAWVAAVAILALLIVLVVVLVRRHHKKKAKKTDIDEEWDEWDADAAHSNNADAPHTADDMPVGEMMTTDGEQATNREPAMGSQETTNGGSVTNAVTTANAEPITNTVPIADTTSITNDDAPTIAVDNPQKSGSDDQSWRANR
jgi:hypothetical protein